MYKWANIIIANSSYVYVYTRIYAHVCMYMQFWLLTTSYKQINGGGENRKKIQNSSINTTEVSTTTQASRYKKLYINNL